MSATLLAQASPDFSAVTLLIAATTGITTDYVVDDLASFFAAVEAIAARFQQAGFEEMGRLLTVGTWLGEGMADSRGDMFEQVLVGLGVGGMQLPDLGLGNAIDGVAHVLAETGSAMASAMTSGLINRIPANGNDAAGNAPVGNAPAGNAPAGNAPAGNAPAGNGATGNGGTGNGTPRNGSQVPAPPPQPEEEVSSLEAANLLSVARRPASTRRASTTRLWPRCSPAAASTPAWL